MMCDRPYPWHKADLPPDQTSIAGDNALKEWTTYHYGPEFTYKGRKVRPVNETTFYVHTFPLGMDPDDPEPDWTPDYGWGSLDHLFIEVVETGEAVEESRWESYEYDELTSYTGWPTVEEASRAAKAMAEQDYSHAILWAPWQEMSR